MIGLLLAVPEVPGEPELVAAASGCGVRVLRRCVDATDLFAAAAADPQAAVVLSAGLPRLTHDVVERIAAGRSGRVIGLAEDADSAELLRGLGVGEVVMTGPTPQATLQALRAATLDRGSPSAEPTVDPTAAPTGVWATGVWDTPADAGPPDAVGSETGREPGQVVAVWGPAGAPGRTTVAMGVAESWAATGLRTCLVDADTYAPSITMALGLVEDSSGLVVACRHADNGTLTPAVLRSVASRVHGEWFVLGGVARAERWAEVRPGALDRVWTVCRDAFDVTVVDVGFCLEDDEGGAWSRRRNAAAIGLLGAADQVLAVADATPLGAARLVAAWPAVLTAAPGAAITVVQNRSRESRSRRLDWARGVAELGLQAPIRRVPRDERAASSCWQGGRSLAEGAPRSALRRSLADVAASVVSG